MNPSTSSSSAAVDNEQYLADKENYDNDDDITKDQTKFAAITELITLFRTTTTTTTAAAAQQQPTTSSGTATNREGVTDSGLELLTKERDHYREQAEMYVKMINEITKQNNHYMEKVKQHQSNIQYFQQEQQRTADTIKVINDRYLSLRSEAEQKIMEADERINNIQKQHDDDTVAMRYKLQQQDVKLKSLDSQINALQTERMGLLDMCDDLVAKSEVASEKTTTITPLKVRNL